MRGYKYQYYTVTECLVDVYIYSCGFINDVFNWIVMNGMVLKYIFHIYLLWAGPDVRFPLTAQTFESCLQLILRKM